MSTTGHLIIGGGLAGLHTAWRLQQAGADWRLIEARPQLGGRIRRPVGASGEPLPLDLGPSWYWPHQHRVPALLSELGIASFEQHTSGDVLYEAGREGPVQRASGGTPMRSLRIEGGTAALVDALAARLDPERIVLGQPLERAVRHDDHWALSVGDDVITARRLYAALPPRLLEPVLTEADISAELRAGLAAQQTWMSAQAKFIAVYDAPFWREAGLSGDAFSRAGPLAEIHDASDAKVEHPALFGFVGVPAQLRAGLDPGQIEAACLHQLTRLFGAAAARPRSAQLMDWSTEAATATAADIAEAPAHAAFRLARFADELAAMELYLAGSEFALGEPGYLEGTLEASSAALASAGLSV